MNKSEVKIGVAVVYARGIKEPLIGKQGIIITSVDESGIVMVDFDSGYSPCWYKNLEKVE